MAAISISYTGEWVLRGYRKLCRRMCSGNSRERQSIEVISMAWKARLSYGRAGPPDPAPRYRTVRDTFASYGS